VLVGTNDYLLFGETIEAVAFRGVESLNLEMALGASGATSLPVDIHSSDCNPNS